jgi:hypothetical protein
MSSTIMAGGNVMDVVLQLARKLCNDGKWQCDGRQSADYLGALQ